MAGFIDNLSQIMEVSLTAEGRRLLSKGELRFVYFRAFDDEIDYDPYISTSGSFSTEELSGTIVREIESSLIQEPLAGYERGVNFSGSDTTNVRNPLFTVPQGQSYLSRMTVSGDQASGSLVSKQRLIQEVEKQFDSEGRPVSAQIKEIGHFRYNSSIFRLEFQHENGLPEARSPGVRFQLLLSSSSGLNRITERRDANGNVSILNDMILEIDRPSRSRDPEPYPSDIVKMVEESK